MSTPAINAITAIVPTPPSGVKAGASQHQFVEKLQVAVEQSNPSAAPATEGSSKPKREDQPADDPHKVETQGQSSEQEHRADASESTTTRDSESDNAEQDDTEAVDTEDTLVVSNAAAEHAAVEDAAAKQLSDELANAQQAGEGSATDNEGEQQQNSEASPAAATTEGGAELLSGENAVPPTDTASAAADTQAEVQPTAEETAAQGDADASDAAPDPTKLATDESLDASEAGADEQSKAVPDPLNQAANTAAPAAVAVDKQPATTDGDAKRSSSITQDTTEGVEAVEPLTQPSPEVDTESETDLSGDADAEAQPTEVREKPQQNSSSFSSILERATGPTARRGGEAESTQTSGLRVDAQRFVGRVTRAFQAAEQRGGSVQLRLAPPELGALRIELNVQNGTLHAKLETETAAAKNVLMDNLPALRDRLAAQDIRIDKFEVDVRQQNSGGQPDWQAQQQQQDAQHQRGSRTGRATTTSTRSTAEELDTSAGGGRQTNHDGQFSAVA